MAQQTLDINWYGSVDGWTLTGDATWGAGFSEDGLQGGLRVFATTFPQFGQPTPPNNVFESGTAFKDLTFKELGIPGGSRISNISSSSTARVRLGGTGNNSSGSFEGSFDPGTGLTTLYTNTSDTNLLWRTVSATSIDFSVSAVDTIRIRLNMSATARRDTGTGTNNSALSQIDNLSLIVTFELPRGRLHGR